MGILRHVLWNLNNPWLLSGFKVGVGKISVSRVNLNYLPTAETLHNTSASSIGVLFHTYWYFSLFQINTSWLKLPFPAIDLFLLRNWWYFQHCFLYDDHVIKAIILFEVTYTLIQRRLWIGFLHILLPLLQCQIITWLLP